jgi:hypothetical protein
MTPTSPQPNEEILMPTQKRRLILKTLFIFILAVAAANLYGQNARENIRIPDIPGYTVLKCDFHVHTVFSDGDVWPTVRVQEAWQEGLDALSITDHLEYTPKKQDIPANHNRPFELAKPGADAVGLILIKGTEITRDEPEAHHNALFITDADKILIEDFMASMKAAADQEAFIFWNHPGWKQPGGRSVWYEVQNELYEKGWLHGLEVANGRTYYPNAHKWCLEKKMTMIGVSDIHGPIGMSYRLDQGEHRPFTLVFVKERSEEGIRDALFARRTAVYWQNIVIGEEQYLRPIFDGSVQVLTPEISLRGRRSAILRISNDSDLPIKLISQYQGGKLRIPQSITLFPDKTVAVSVSATSRNISGSERILLPFIVENFYVAPEEGMPVQLPIKFDFIPES